MRACEDPVFAVETLAGVPISFHGDRFACFPADAIVEDMHLDYHKVSSEAVGKETERS